MKSHTIPALLTILILASACATKPGSVSEAPDVTISQSTRVPNLGVTVAKGVPMEYRIKIVNPFDYPVTLISIEIESVGESGAYGMRRVRHAFKRTVAARSVENVDIRAWVFPLQGDAFGDSTTPVSLRGTARFESPQGSMRRNFVGRGQ